MIKFKKIKWSEKDTKISQIPTEGLEYAMLSTNYEQVNQMVWCKDFMHDLIYSHVNSRSIDIYNFKYSPWLHPRPCTSRIRLMIANCKDAEFGERIMQSMLPILHEVENELQMSQTKIYKCLNDKEIYKRSGGIWILDGSKRWLKSPPMVSLYTMIVRLGLAGKPGESFRTTLKKIGTQQNPAYFDKNNREAELVRQARYGIDFIMKYTDKRIFSANLKRNYCIPSYANTYKFDDELRLIHNCCGIVGFSNGDCRRLFPNWYRIKI